MIVVLRVIFQSNLLYDNRQLVQQSHEIHLHKCLYKAFTMKLLKNLQVKSKSQVKSQSPTAKKPKDRVQGYKSDWNSRLDTL